MFVGIINNHFRTNNCWCKIFKGRFLNTQVQALLQLPNRPSNADGYLSTGVLALFQTAHLYYLKFLLHIGLFIVASIDISDSIYLIFTRLIKSSFPLGQAGLFCMDQ